MGLWDKLKGAFGKDAGTPEQQFLRLAREIAERTDGVRVLEERPQDFLILLQIDGAAEPAELYLGNMYREFAGFTPAERARRVEAVLRELVASHRDAPLDWEEARPRLVPVLRSASSFTVGDRLLPAVRRVFLPFLYEAVVLDQETTMQYVTESHLKHWGVREDEIFETAGRHLSSCDHNVAPYQAGSALWRVATDDDYQSSRLVLADWLGTFEGKVKGRPVAIVPDRQTLVIGGDGDADQLARLLALAEEKAEASPRPLSTVLYTLGDKRAVVPLELAQDHPLAGRLRHAQILFEGTEYHRQKEHLEAVFERDQIDIFVASYGAIRGKDGVELSYTSWGENIDSLLPRTHVVALGGGSPSDRWMALVRWEDVERLAGDCLQPHPGCYPPRYRTVRWPSPDTVAALKLVQLSA